MSGSPAEVLKSDLTSFIALSGREGCVLVKKNRQKENRADNEKGREGRNLRRTSNARDYFKTADKCLFPHIKNLSAKMKRPN